MPTYLEQPLHSRRARSGQRLRRTGQSKERPSSIPATVPLSTLIAKERRAAAGAFAQDQFDIDSPWHYHDMHQLQYAFEGSIEVEDRARRSLLPRMLAAWIPAGVAHRTSVHRVRSGSVLFASHLVPNAGDRVRIVLVSELMRAMVIGSMRWQLGKPLDATGSAYFKALALLCGEWIEAEAPLSLPTSNDPALNAAMSHARLNMATATIGSASAAANLSERSLRRRFQSIAGMGWDEYLRRARLLAAVERLANSRAPIGRIAADLGYQSQGAFAKVFRQFLGVSPSEFRERE
jgi:AraC-like DNA-binding protein